MGAFPPHILAIGYTALANSYMQLFKAVFISVMDLEKREIVYETNKKVRKVMFYLAPNSLVTSDWNMSGRV